MNNKKELVDIIYSKDIRLTDFYELFNSGELSYNEFILYASQFTKFKKSRLSKVLNQNPNTLKERLLDIPKEDKIYLMFNRLRHSFSFSELKEIITDGLDSIKDMTNIYFDFENFNHLSLQNFKELTEFLSTLEIGIYISLKGLSDAQQFLKKYHTIMPISNIHHAYFYQTMSTTRTLNLNNDGYFFNTYTKPSALFEQNGFCLFYTYLMASKNVGEGLDYLINHPNQKFIEWYAQTMVIQPAKLKVTLPNEELSFKNKSLATYSHIVWIKLVINMLLDTQYDNKQAVLHALKEVETPYKQELLDHINSKELA